MSTPACRQRTSTERTKYEHHVRINDHNGAASPRSRCEGREFCGEFFHGLVRTDRRRSRLFATRFENLQGEFGRVKYPHFRLSILTNFSVWSCSGGATDLGKSIEATKLR